jgi:ubiquinone/menaquinone biosynthesis C-methylase UbiE/glycosyltransferase involved in cell wall biosynthesis
MTQKLLVLPRYEQKGASSRYRLYNYVDQLEKNGFECIVSPLFSNLYIAKAHSKSSVFFEAIKCYFKRVVFLFKKRKYDLCLIEKELFPFIPYWLEVFFLSFLGKYVVDYDDAIFHRYDEHDSLIVRLLLSNKISKVMSGASAVIAGNQYIYDYAINSLAFNTIIIPTVVDVDLYDNTIVVKNKQFTIVWIGSESTIHYVEKIKGSIIEACNKTNGKFVVIGANIHIPDIQLELVDWSTETEKKYLKSSHVGIMPLTDDNWDKGKCGFKIIQYLASNIPVVASPTGVNSVIIQHGFNGYLASTPDDWIDCIFNIFNNIENKKIVSNGYKVVRESYSIDSSFPKLLKTLTNAVDSKNNFDLNVIKGFGKEWSHFKNENLEESLNKIWLDYFSIFPWDILPDDGGIGADIGCGSGRWSYFVANRVKKLYLIDPSIEALNVSKEKLNKFNNIEYINQNIEGSMQEIEMLDFAFSLGVLHHVPDIKLAFKSITCRLKKGAPFLVYIYYSFDNKPAWYSKIWIVTNFLRKVISRLPANARLLITQIIAYIIYFPVSRFGYLLQKAGFNVNQYPLIYYADKPFYFMKNDALDRFGTKLEKRFSRKEILEIFKESGFVDVKFSDSAPYWCAYGIKE